MDIIAYNSAAWDHLVSQGNQWTQAVDPETVERARHGELELLLTPNTPVPRAWLGDLKGRDVLGLASSGGQQGPLMAAAGARVTVFDNSPAQLAQDRAVAQREGLELRLIQGDMRDLSALEDDSFDLIFHPCSNVFCPEVRPVWRECARVLRTGGTLLAGFGNPAIYLFDHGAAYDEGRLEVRHKLPYSDLGSLTEQERARFTDANEPLEYSHSLDDQIGGQLDAGLALIGFFEDTWNTHPLDQYMKTYLATRSIKLPV